MIGWIAKTRQAHISNAVREDPRVTDHAWAKREGKQAFAGFPLIAEDRLVGVLEMFSRHVLEDSVLEEFVPLTDALSKFIQRRHAGQELARAEKLKAAILGTSMDAIVAMDATGKVVEFNYAAEQMSCNGRSAAARPAN